MNIKSLIITLFIVASASANATVVTTAGAVASANAQAAHRIEQEHINSAIYSVKNALNNRNMVLVPCEPRTIGGLFEKSRLDRELTLEDCEEEKQKFERMNGVRYKFGKAVSHDNYRNYFYFELIEE